MTGFFDTHCHLQDPAFAGEAPDIFARARAAGVIGMLVCGYDAASNLSAVGMANATEGVYAAVGFHPHDARDFTPAALALLSRQAGLPTVVAVGEIGLDFYRDLSPRDLQREALDAQLALAIEVGKPVSVHTRGAEDEIYAHLASFAARTPLAGLGRPVGVMHCFGGTLEQARRFVEIGFLVSIACTITYPKNDVARRIAAELPLESLVVETDSPHLPPQALRGKRNEPAHVRSAAETIASVRGISLDAVAAATTRNAQRLLGLTMLVGAA